MGRSVMTAARAVDVRYYLLSDDEEHAANYIEGQGIDPESAEADDVRGWSSDAWGDAQRWEWDDFVESIRAALTSRYSSFRTEDAWYWYSQEVHVIASNGLVDVAVAEYCGMVSVSVVATCERVEMDSQMCGISRAWAGRMGARIGELISGEVSLSEWGKLGTFSNGESVYTRVA